MTSHIAEVLKLAAKPIQYDNDKRTWLEFRFKLENYLTLVNEKYVQALSKTQSLNRWRTFQQEEKKLAVTIRTLSHALYAIAGDTDHLTKLEAGAKSTEQKWVRDVETAGGRERAEDRESEIRDVASRATAGNG